MVYYKENPDLKKLQTVTTIKGDVEYRKNTKYIKEKYYTINRDCIELSNGWYDIKDNNVIYDHERQVYMLKTSREAAYLAYGLVVEDDKLTMGYFTKNIYNNVLINSKIYGSVLALNKEILLKNDWYEDLGNNMWFSSEEQMLSTIKKQKIIRNEKNYTDRGYNIEDNRDYGSKMDEYEGYPIVISDKAALMSKFLGDISFGIEYELQKGCISNNLKSRYGVVVCRDGSLHGGAELVTVPLKGAKGLQSTVDLCNELKHNTTIGLDCSLHIHFGNLKKQKEYIIALYILSRSIQNELFTMFPYYKIQPDGVKQKNYTKRLLKLNINNLKDDSDEAWSLYIADSWNKLFNFYSEGLITESELNPKTRKHPIERKWEQKNRYYFFNFMNLFFGNRYTAEMRLHTPTTNSHKVINWLFICVAIIKYAEKYYMDIIKNNKTISMKGVLDIYSEIDSTDQKGKFLSDYLYAYFKARQARCKKDYEKGDYISDWDITEDKTFTFSYNDVEGLI